MNVQGYQKMTLLDFPGKVACTVFTGGCNLRCPFCHNASLVMEPNENGDATADVLSYLEKRRGILDGVCITGGEPLLQADLDEFILRVREMGLAVKLDTNGTLPRQLKALLDRRLLDYVAMDIKSAPAHYSRAAGVEVDLTQIEQSIALIQASGIPHEFRTTAVKGIHLPEDFVAIAHLVGDSPYFIQRFVDSGNLLGTGCSAFSEEEGRQILSLVSPIAPHSKLRGQEDS